MSVAELVRPEASELNVSDFVAIQNLSTQLSDIRQELPLEASLRATANILLANEDVVNAGLSSPDSVLETLGWFQRLEIKDATPDRPAAVIEAQETAICLLERSAPALTKTLQDSTNPRLWFRIVETIGQALKVAEPGEMPQLVACVAQLMPVHLTHAAITNDTFIRTRLPYDYRNVLPQLLRHSLGPEQRQIGDIIVDLALDESTSRIGLEVLDSLEEGDNVHYGNELVNSIAPRFGFDPTKLMHAWGQSVKSEDFAKYSRENLVQMCRLEAKIPGICKALYDKFDIENFARCKDEQWLDQYEYMWATTGDHAFVQFSKEDSNGAFWHMRDLTEQLAEKSGAMGCRVRMYEFSGPATLAGNVVRDFKRYGKAEYGVVSSHMNSDTIGPRNNGNGKITEQHLSATGLDKFETYLPPQLFMNGCTIKPPRAGPNLQKKISERFPEVTVTGGPDNEILSPTDIALYKDVAGKLALTGAFQTLNHKRWRLRDDDPERKLQLARDPKTAIKNLIDHWLEQVYDLSSPVSRRAGKIVTPATRSRAPGEATGRRKIPAKIVTAIGGLVYLINGPNRE